jgi:two-component system, NtrC family, nitrogen regulation sensor histidine kinase NtrY
LFFVGVFIGNNSSVERYYQNKANEFLSDELGKLEEIQTLVVNDPSLKQSIAKLDAKLLPTQLLANYHLSLFVYNKNNCVLWTDNQTLHHHFGINKHPNTYQIQNQNGWYQIVAKKIDSFDVYCYFNYYRKYPIASEFFKSGFHSSLNLGTVQLIDSELKNLNEGNISQSETLPEVENTGFSASKINRLQLFLLFFSVLFFLIYIIWGIYSSAIPLHTSLLYIMWFLTISSSFILFDFYFINLEAFTLFSPELAAYSHMVPSFGHGLLLAFVVLFFCGLAYWYSQNNWKVKVKSIYLYSLIISLKSFFWLSIVLVILPDFINNSYVNYDFKDVSNLSVFSFFGFLNIFLLVAVWVILNRIFRNVLIFSVVEFKKNWKLNGLIYLFNVLLFRFIQGENLFLLISCLVFLFIVDWFVFKPVRLRINHLFWVFSLSAGLLSVQLEQLNSHKEKEQRKIFANKIISNQDAEVEFKLNKIENEMIATSAFERFYYFKGSDYQELELNFKFTYLNDFVKSYNIDFMSYDSSGSNVSPNNIEFTFIDQLYNSSINKGFTNYFLYIKDINYLGAYIAKYEICPDKQTLGYVYLLLTPKIKSETYNLDYFFSLDNNFNPQNKKYAYAVYSNNQLVKSSGNYSYKLVKDYEFDLKGDESFVDFNKYSHFYKRIDSESFILVSKKEYSKDRIFSVFSFAFFLFNLFLVIIVGSVYLLVYILYLFRRKRMFMHLYVKLTKLFRLINLDKIYLETKIRFYFLILSLGIFFTLILVVVNNVSNNFKDQQRELLDKQMMQITNEIELSFQNNNGGSIRNLIKDLANQFELDINFYYTDGTLFQTANNRMFFDGWFSNFINPLAYNEIVVNKKSQFKQMEQIGNLKYTASYGTIFDKDRQLVGFLNVPYFSRNLDLNEQFSNFLSSLINILIVMLVLTLLLSMQIGAGLVKPLKLVIESLTKIKLGSSNEPIQISRNDEIGQLVMQYNHMLEKLEESSNKLALSEREGAWKEMAKQVAHEIKNPLTPMKLHLQHLQFLIQRKDPNLTEKITEVSKILIEQIDQLSHMAEEFSSFAKMPISIIEKVNVEQILQTTVQLFTSFNQLEIEMNALSNPVEVNADPQQLQRVFTNIIKNAHQAVKESEVCVLKIDTKVTGNSILISFTDNGKGIEPELKDKLFVPNFSTKNSGMGLGLSISKRIIEGFNGEIWFETEVNIGTTFYVKLPIIV